MQSRLTSVSICRPLRVALLLALAPLACVAQERRDANDAQEAYDRCVAQHSEAFPDCVALKERLFAMQRRYQENARRAWSCDPAQEQCPTPR